MSYGSVGKALRTLRANRTQLQFSISKNVSRETISAYEREVVKVPKVIAVELMKDFDDPFFALTIRQQYTGTGPVYLDGEEVDLHRSSVKEKTIEEMEEALEKLRGFCTSKPFSKLTAWEKQDLEVVLREVAEAEVAMNHLIGVMCKESGISFVSVWDKVYDKLLALRYITKETFKQIKKHSS